MAQTTSAKWTRCKQVSDVTSGGVFIIGYEATANSGTIVPMRKEGSAAVGSKGYIYSGTTSGTSEGSTVDMSTVSETSAYEVTINNSKTVDGAVTIKIGDNYLGCPEQKKAALYEAESENTALTVSVATNDVFELANTATQSKLQCNTNKTSWRFAFYGGTGATTKNVVLYKKAVSSVVVSGTPTKTEYQAGDEFNPAGLVVTVNYVDGTRRVADNGVTWTIKSGALTEGQTSVTVTATSDGKESAEILVTGLTVVAAKTLSSITVSGTPEEFWKGDTFNNNGMTVTANWGDNTSTNVTSESDFSTPDMSTAGIKNVTVTYREKTAKYQIEVKTIENTKASAYTVSEAKALIDAGKDLDTKVYVKGIVSKIVTAYSSGVITFDISSDGTAESDQFQFYRNQKDASHKYTGDPGIVVGMYVVGYGQLDKYYSTYELKSGNYLVEPSKLDLVAKSGENYYATFSSDKAVKFVDAEVYAVNVNGDKIELNSVDSKSVPANTGVLIKSTAETASYRELKSADAIDNNLLKAASVTMSSSDKNYKLAYNNYTAKTGLGFYYGAANGGEFAAKTGGAYLAVPSSLTLARCFTFDDVETGINTIEVADEANTAAEVYDLAGRRVSKAQKGLYIVNGVKVIK